MTEPLTDRGSLLRWWRVELTDLSLEAVARAVGVRSQATVHNWETGHTEGPSIAQLRAMDTRYKAGRTLEGLYAAIRTPRALQAAEHWWKNFQGPSGPCWAWLRVEGDRPGVARVEAGPFAVDVDVPPGTGVFVQAYAFPTNPAVHVAMDLAGWVDFGYGVVPSQIGAAAVDAAEHVVIGARPLSDHSLVWATGVWLPGKFGGRSKWFEEVKRRFGQRIESARKALVAVGKAPIGVKSDLTKSHASRGNVPQWWEGPRYEALRLARGLSLSDLAEAASALDDTLPKVSRDNIHRFEHGVTPRLLQLAERLDMALGADGRTCTVEVPSSQVEPTVIEINFPSYWIGPVWVQFLAPGDARTEGDAMAGTQNLAKTRGRLVWRPWHKWLLLRDGVVVTTRRSARGQQPLRVESPPGWSVIAGVGVHPRAVDVQEGWGLVSTTAASEAIGHYYGLLEQAMRQTTTARDLDEPVQ